MVGTVVPLATLSRGAGDCVRPLLRLRRPFNVLCVACMKEDPNGHFVRRLFTECNKPWRGGVLIRALC